MVFAAEGEDALVVTAKGLFSLGRSVQHPLVRSEVCKEVPASALKARFVSHPFPGVPGGMHGSRCYRTGGTSFFI